MSVTKSKYRDSKTRWLGIIKLSPVGAQMLLILSILGLFGFFFALITITIGIIRTQIMFGYISQQGDEYVNAYSTDIMYTYIPALFFVLFMIIFCIYSTIIALRISKGR